jgi:hypothetical protein
MFQVSVLPLSGVSDDSGRYFCTFGRQAPQSCSVISRQAGSDDYAPAPALPTFFFQN